MELLTKNQVFLLTVALERGTTCRNGKVHNAVGICLSGMLSVTLL